VTTLQLALIPTLVLGCVYALVGMGFVVLFRSTGILSFAQGSLMAIGALLFYTLVTDAHWPLGLALPVTAGICGAVGGLLYLGLFDRLVGASPLLLSFATVGLSIVLEAIATLIWGSAPRQDPVLLHFPNVHINGNIVVTPVQLLTISVTLLVGVALVVVMRNTPTGLRMRATADGQSLATYYGINVTRVSALAWGLAGLCAGAGGVIYSLATAVDPAALPNVGLAVFPGVILGGVDSLGGAALGGLIVAALGTLLAIGIGGEWQDVSAYAVLLLVLLVRPRGLLGGPDVTRL
jgi:branched-chain amino acid transport system permease protein